jgi:hypothetical protein
MLVERLRRDVPQATVRRARFGPAEGALLEAYRAGGVPWSEALLANMAGPAA